MKKNYMRHEVVPKSVCTVSAETLSETGCFHVGGSYLHCNHPIAGEDAVMSGQMYVEVYVPKEIRHPYPLVLFHGNGQTGVGYMQTLRGKPGWVHDFLGMGYVVYVVDQPERGRSICHKENGERLVWPAAATAKLFCDPKGYPGSEKHTMWPGAGIVGDPIYDAFYMTQVDSLASAKRPQELIRACGDALFRKIGPAILLAHSQSGPFAWILGNDHPEMVKAMIAIEPSGPPFTNVQTGAALVDETGRPTNYGVSHVPLAFDPPLGCPAEIELRPVAAPDADKLSGYLPKHPRLLKNLTDIPLLVLSAEASYHTPYDYLTAQFFREAGVSTDYVMLGDVGIHGNGHMMMIEDNSSCIAAYLDHWIGQQNL